MNQNIAELFSKSVGVFSNSTKISIVSCPLVRFKLMSLPWLVWVTSVNVWPTRHGCDSRVCNLTLALAREFRICLVVSDQASIWQHRTEASAHIPFTRLISVENGRLLQAPTGDEFHSFSTEYWEPVRKIVQELRPRVVCVSYVWMCEVLRHLPDDCCALKIVDANDVMSSRNQIFGKFGLEPWCICSEKQEVFNLQAADVVLAIQPDELKEFEKMIDRHVDQNSKPRVSLLMHPVHTVNCQNGDSRDSKLTFDVLFVGSRNPSNQDALQWLLNEIWPKVNVEVPDASLGVCGEVNFPEATDCKHVKRLGFLNDNDLQQAECHAKIIVNTARAGTGLKIKTVEGQEYRYIGLLTACSGLAMGKAVVTTSVGSSGLESLLEEDEPMPMLIANDANTFASSIIDLLHDEDKRALLSRAAHRFFNKWLSEDAIRSAFREITGDH